MRDDTNSHFAFENSVEGVLVSTPDGKIDAANPRACELLAMTEAQICAAGRDNLVVQDDAARHFIAERARLGRFRGTLTMRRGDGSTFLAEVASSLTTLPGGEQRAVVSFDDVTERERSRRALEILANAGPALVGSLDTRALLNAITGLIVPKLADVCIVDLFLDGRVQRMAVAHRDPARAAPYFALRRPDIGTSGVSPVEQLLHTGEPQVRVVDEAFVRAAAHDAAELELLKGLGMHSMVTVGLKARGRLVGALTLLSTGGVPPFTEADVPLVRALAERTALALDNARQHLEVVAARKLRDEMMGIVSHDLRNPLNVIQIQAGLLAKRNPGPELDSIKAAVKRADRLIQDLLLVAKMEGGTLSLQPELLAVGPFLEELEKAQRTLAESKAIALEVSAGADAGELFADRHRVAQLLSNLIDNALKFTPANGRVQLTANAEGEGVRFSVADTGKGITPAELPHVFDRFWQGAHAQRAGAGLGLAIAQGVATAHGGKITVESNPGEGTRFHVWFPRRPPAIAVRLDSPLSGLAL